MDSGYQITAAKIRHVKTFRATALLSNYCHKIYIGAGLSFRLRNLSFLSPPTMSGYSPETEVDMTQPASSILKAGTAEIHEEIGNSEGVSYLAKGELDREEYIRCLMMFWHIYECVFSLCNFRRVLTVDLPIRVSTPQCARRGFGCERQ